ncbi:hypothetical protein SARC_01554 [Sphaeroforma arctica JP610]|uniref:Uncharacterized protein n=1 Tax=Sphaeroforma arctica JP610 TaxID=667725 RepID=A0A0L0GB95_9EUKA|nr:hypothetical protein SARC_01554 [Sphaeroforma arctica JP610]KNC86292.1 hypothetical protein SARC_01554 [Sphaeroforma arctica JP610]|eukprot:XP_014160194.1 hypothetical protein SARC_01554 [Sphaeroforma arctica JP610]
MNHDNDLMIVLVARIRPITRPDATLFNPDFLWMSSKPTYNFLRKKWAQCSQESVLKGSVVTRGNAYSGLSKCVRRSARVRDALCWHLHCDFPFRPSDDTERYIIPTPDTSCDADTPPP